MPYMAILAQVVRALGRNPEGRRFESDILPQRQGEIVSLEVVDLVNPDHAREGG